MSRSHLLYSSRWGERLFWLNILLPCSDSFSRGLAPSFSSRSYTWLWFSSVIMYGILLDTLMKTESCVTSTLGWHERDNSVEFVKRSLHPQTSQPGTPILFFLLWFLFYICVSFCMIVGLQLVPTSSTDEESWFSAQTGKVTTTLTSFHTTLDSSILLLGARRKVP